MSEPLVIEITMPTYANGMVQWMLKRGKTAFLVGHSFSADLAYYDARQSVVENQEAEAHEKAALGLQPIILDVPGPKEKDPTTKVQA